MWKMILGQAILQLVVVFVLEYAGMSILNYHDVPANVIEKGRSQAIAKALLNNTIATQSDIDNSIKLISDAYHGFKEQEIASMVFNTFVFLQIFNEVNCRRLDNRLNIFAGVLQNNYFMVIFVIMVAFQVIIIEVGGEAFKTEKLNGSQWAICIVLGLLSLPVGVIIRLIPDELFGGIKDWVNNAHANDGRLPAFDAYPGKQEVGRANSIPASISSNRTNSISSGSNVYPGREGLVWNSAITKARSELSVFKSIRGGRLSTDSDRSNHAIQAAAVVPSLVATSVGAGWTPNRGRSTPGNSSSQVNLSNSSPRNSTTGSRRGTGQSMVRPATPLATSAPASDAVNTTSS
jgi:Ca2+-transporting ATPase